MPTINLTELEEFHRFVGNQLQKRDRPLSPEGALELFRQREVTTGEFTSSVAAVSRALEQADRGEGIPLAEAMQMLRDKHGLPQIVDDE